MSAYVPIPLPYAGLISMFLVRAMVGRIGPKVNAVTFDATEERIHVHFAVTVLDEEVQEDIDEIVDELACDFYTLPDLKPPPVEAKVHVGSALSPWPGKAFQPVYWSKTDHTSSERPLTSAERAVLDVILAGYPSLRAQLDHVLVTAEWPSGPASFDVRVVGGPVADVEGGVLPVDTTVFGEGGEVVGEILIWVADGRLAAVEHPWYTDEPPVALPPIDRIAVQRRDISSAAQQGGRVSRPPRMTGDLIMETVSGTP